MNLSAKHNVKDFGHSAKEKHCWGLNKEGGAHTVRVKVSLSTHFITHMTWAYVFNSYKIWEEKNRRLKGANFESVSQTIVM